MRQIEITIDPLYGLSEYEVPAPRRGATCEASMQYLANRFSPGTNAVPIYTDSQSTAYWVQPDVHPGPRTIVRIIRREEV